MDMSLSKLREIVKDMQPGMLQSEADLWLASKVGVGTPLVIQWFRLYTSNAEGAGSILGRKLRSHMPHSATRKKN